MFHQPMLIEIRSLIARDEVDTALEKMQDLLQNSSYSNEFILQSARWSDVSRQVRLGLVNSNQADQAKNHVREELIKLLRKIELSESFSPPAPEEDEKHDSEEAIIQRAEKIYNIKKIDQANFS